MLEIKKIENEDVYDITVADNHNFFANGILVHNCAEIGMKPVTEDGRSGWQFCNLTEINGAKITSKQLLERACKAASILGTIQAGYTNFNYVTQETREITEREALIGVGITGWMNNPDVLFDVENMRDGATLVKETNAEIARLIGINAAARTTTTKPSGNACLTFDGVIRTERGNKTLAQIFEECSNGEFSPDESLSDSWRVVDTELSVYDENDSLQRITALYVNGVTDVYEVEFEDGVVYKFTENHKLKTARGWVKVRDLTEEDSICQIDIS